MSIIEKHLAFVKEQQAVQEKLARRYESDAWRSERHVKSAVKFKELADDIANLSVSEIKPFAVEKSITRAGIYLTFKDIEGLPEDLLKELSVSESDKLEFSISTVIEEAGGVLSLDKLLVGIYLKTKEIVRRSVLISRLYRMAQKGLIFPVANKKGIYSTRDLSEEDLKKLFGQDDGAPEFE